MVDTLLDGISHAAVSFIESCEQSGSEMHRPDPVVNRFKPEVFTGENFADKDKPVTPGQAAVCVDLAYSKMSRVSDLRLVFRISARGRPIQGRRDFAIERAMGLLLV